MTEHIPRKGRRGALAIFEQMWRSSEEEVLRMQTEVEYLQAEIAKLKEALATCRELREHDRTAVSEIRKLREEMRDNGLLRK
jgi:uncharacterized protein YlxW (UPF0749 family)